MHPWLPLANREKQKTFKFRLNLRDGTGKNSPKCSFWRIQVVVVQAAKIPPIYRQPGAGVLNSDRMGTRILFLGEIVGKAGVYAVKTGLPKLRKELGVDGVIANGDGVTHGFGLGKNHSIYLRKLGVDVITGGDQIYFKRDLHEHMDHAPYILRPANFPPGNPGRGWRYYQFGQVQVGVVNLLGLAGYNRIHLSNPFSFLPEIIKRLSADTKFIVLDFHSCTTAEKATMSLMMDGKLAAVMGTGMRTLTADAEILPKGTASISDLGRCGSMMSVAGFKPEPEIQQFVTGIPERSQESWLGIELQGALVNFDDAGKATSIDMLRVPVDPPQTTAQMDDAEG